MHESSLEIVIPQICFVHIEILDAMKKPFLNAIKHFIFKRQFLTWYWTIKMYQLVKCQEIYPDLMGHITFHCVI